MAEQRTLANYLLKGGAENRAFISDCGEVYIVKGFRLIGELTDIAVIDADLITLDNPRKRTGLPLSGPYTHLYDRKATFSEIRRARLGIGYSQMMPALSQELVTH